MKYYKRIDSNVRYFLHVPFLNKRTKCICIFRQLGSDIFCNVNDRRSQEIYKPRRDTNMAAGVFAGKF